MLPEYPTCFSDIAEEAILNSEHPVFPLRPQEKHRPCVEDCPHREDSEAVGRELTYKELEALIQRYYKGCFLNCIYRRV